MIDDAAAAAAAPDTIMIDAVDAVTPADTPATATTTADHPPLPGSSFPASSPCPALGHSLCVDRILRQRFVGDLLQYRIKWFGMQTETWASGAQIAQIQDSNKSLQKLIQFQTWAKENVEQSFREREETQTTTTAPTATPAKKRRRRKNPDSTVAGDGDGTSHKRKRRSRSTSVVDPAAAVRSSTRIPKPTTTMLDEFQEFEREVGSASKRTRGTANKRAIEAALRLADHLEAELDAIAGDSDSASNADALASQGLYEVEQFLGDVWEGGIHWYRVKWRGYSDFDNSWQRPEDLTGCQTQLRAYWTRKRAKLLEREENEKDERRKKARMHLEKKKALIDLASSKAASIPHTGITSSVAPSSAAGDADGDLHSQVKAAAAAATAATTTPLATVTPDATATTPNTTAIATAIPATVTTGVGNVSDVIDTTDEDYYPIESFLSLHDAQCSITRSNTPTQHVDVHDDPPALGVSLVDGMAVHDESAIDGHPIGYESDTQSTRTDDSTTSLLMHPQHKHVNDTPQCILTHDWYECENDESQWLLLVKWKHLPVAQCSWEPRDSLFFAGHNKMVLTKYLKEITDAHLRAAIQRNIKP